MSYLPALGAIPLTNDRVRFTVWAPNCEEVAVRLTGPEDRTMTLQGGGHGYFSAEIEGVHPGDRYTYLLDGELERPDPASRFQPEGVHGPSAVVDPDDFAWSDHGWRGHPLSDFVIYEMHIGTFSEPGTFDGAIEHLDDLVDLGITVVEIMPVAQFPGERNWGYDGVGLYAVQDSYGGPNGLRQFVDACHQRGLSVVLDVVYNHLGPEGNYLRDFGPYFTDHYQTPWGEAINFDGPQSDHVRHYFIENARYWLREFHLDGFRLDAVHAIYDMSATHVLEELASEIDQEADRLGRPAAIIAESDLNDPKVIRNRELGGWGHDAQWADDLHHALHALLTDEHNGYYVDYGEVRHLVDSLSRGYMFTGQYSSHRRRKHGRSPGTRDGRRFVVCSQNHDQVGNRAAGDRLTVNLDFDQLKLAAAATILTPFTPMLFMGEEYAEPNPFQYFVSHGDPDLVTAVQEGRRREFEAFNWQVEVPDPQAESTFQHSKLNHSLKRTEPHAQMFGWYQELLRLRRTLPALRSQDLDAQQVWAVPGTRVVAIRRLAGMEECLILMNFSGHQEQVKVDLPEHSWSVVLNSLDERWDGSGEEAPMIAVNHGVADLVVGSRAVYVYQGRPINDKS